MPFSSIHPLGRDATKEKPWVLELIQPVSKMAELIRDKVTGLNGHHLPEVLSSSCFVFGDEAIHKMLKEKSVEVLRDISDQTNFMHVESTKAIFDDDIHVANHTSQLFKNISLIMEETDADISFGNKAINQKDIMFRRITIFLRTLALINGIFDRYTCQGYITGLLENGVLDETAAHNLMYAVTLSYEGRLKWFIAQNDQEEAYSITVGGDLSKLLYETIGVTSAEALIATLVDCDRVIKHLYQTNRRGGAIKTKIPNGITFRQQDAFIIENYKLRYGIVIGPISNLKSCFTRLKTVEAFVECISFVLSRNKAIIRSGLEYKSKNSVETPIWLGDTERLSYKNSMADVKRQAMDILTKYRSTTYAVTSKINNAIRKRKDDLSKDEIQKVKQLLEEYEVAIANSTKQPDAFVVACTECLSLIYQFLEAGLDRSGVMSSADIFEMTSQIANIVGNITDEDCGYTNVQNWAESKAVVGPKKFHALISVLKYMYHTTNAKENVV